MTITIQQLEAKNVQAALEVLAKALTHVAELQAENATLKAQLAAAQKDAERYRWLRERMDLKDVSIIRLRNDPNEDYDSEVDVAIDAAIAQEVK